MRRKRKSTDFGLLTMNPMNDFPERAKTSMTFRKLPIANDGRLTEHPLLITKKS